VFRITSSSREEIIMGRDYLRVGIGFVGVGRGIFAYRFVKIG
jgi:hypothetical protein